MWVGFSCVNQNKFATVVVLKFRIKQKFKYWFCSYKLAVGIHQLA